MIDVAGNEINVGDRVLHFQKGSTSVFLQIGEITQMKESSGTGWSCVPDSVKIRRGWTNGWQGLDTESKWMYASRVLKI